MCAAAAALAGKALRSADGLRLGPITLSPGVGWGVGITSFTIYGGSQREYECGVRQREDRILFICGDFDQSFQLFFSSLFAGRIRVYNSSLGTVSLIQNTINQEDERVRTLRGTVCEILPLSCHIFECSNYFLALPLLWLLVNYGGQRAQNWTPRPLCSLPVYLKVALNLNFAVR